MSDWVQACVRWDIALHHCLQIRTAIEKAKPRSKKVHKVKPWISMGSEVGVSYGRSCFFPPALTHGSTEAKGG